MTFTNKNDGYLPNSDLKASNSELQVIDDQNQSKSSPYSELHSFLQQIEEQVHPFIDQPYFSSKKKVLTYKVVFLLFGILFLTLGWLVLVKNPNWIYQSLLFDRHFIQYAVVGITWGLSALSGFIGWSIQTEHEVLNFLAYNAKITLKKKFQRKRAQFSFLRILPFSECYRKNDSLTQKYLDSLEKITHTREDYIHLLKRITSATSLDKDAKETLFNQTLLKFREFTDSIVHRFNVCYSENQSDT